MFIIQIIHLFYTLLNFDLEIFIDEILFCIISKQAAITIIIPVAIYCQNESTPTTINPTLNADNNIVPSIVHSIVPLPPIRLVPPTAAAAIAFNS